jgi:hypothetical protein
MIENEIDMYEENEISHGTGKKRRPTMDEDYFADIFKRVEEVNRRKQEDNDSLFT